MVAEHSYNDDHPYAMARATKIRKDIMKTVGMDKGFSLPIPHTVTTEPVSTGAETDFINLDDAILAFHQIPDGGGDYSAVIKFKNAVWNLPSDALGNLKIRLESAIVKRDSVADHPRVELEVPTQFPIVPPLETRIPEAADAALDHNRNVLTVHMHDSRDEIVLPKGEFIMKMAGKVKGFTPPLLEAATTEAESNYCIEDALLAFRQISGDNRSAILKFQTIVGKLPDNDLRTLEKLLEESYLAMLRSEMDCPYPTSPPEVKAASGGGDGFVTKFAGQAIGVMVAKVAGGAVFRAFEAPAILEPLEEAAGAVGLMSVIGGMVLLDKKPGLSKAMVKFGSVAIALAVIVPTAGNLDDPIISWISGALATTIVAVTTTFA